MDRLACLDVLTHYGEYGLHHIHSRGYEFVNTHLEVSKLLCHGSVQHYH